MMSCKKLPLIPSETISSTSGAAGFSTKSKITLSLEVTYHNEMKAPFDKAHPIEIANFYCLPECSTIGRVLLHRLIQNV